MTGLRRLFERLAASPAVRRAGENLSWLLGEKLLRLCGGLLVGAWVARYLGPEQFGAFSYVLALVGLLLFLPVLGLDDVARRDLLEARDDSSAALVLGTTWRLRVLAGLVLWIGFVVSVWTQGWAAPSERLLLSLGGLMLLQPALCVPELFFQARDQSRRAARVQLVGLVAGVVMRVSLVLGRASLVWFVLAVLGEVLVMTLLYWHLARRSGLGGWWRTWDPVRAKRLLRAGFPLLLAGAAVSVYMKIDQVMLRAMSGEAEAGVYAAAVRLSEAVYFVPVATVMVLLPMWSQAREGGGARRERTVQGIYDLMTVMACGFALPVSFLSSWLVSLLFGADFAAAGPVLAIHAWAAVFVFQGVVRSQEWVFENLNRWTLVTTVAGAVTNVWLNWLWIPDHGAKGAAFATLASYALAVWVLPFAFSATRSSAWRQTKALLFPVTGWRYVWTSNPQRDPTNH